MVKVASIFRDAENYVERYFAQIADLRLHIPVQCYLAEGDSTDETFKAIEDYLWDDDRCFQIEHGGPKFDSVDHPQRWNQIAQVCNGLLDEIPADGPLIYVESDLLWQADTMLALLEDLTTVDAVAPMSMKDSGFYDTWGHRGLDGAKFNRPAPYHPDLAGALGLVRISSAGSCIAMHPEVYSVCRWGENDGMVGFCRDITMHGFGLFVDPAVEVTHP